MEVDDADASDLEVEDNLHEEVNNSNAITTYVPKVSYAAVAGKDSIPSKEQGIILEKIDGTNIETYIRAIGTLVQPKNIISASIISNRRVCIFLSNRTITDNLLENHPNVVIKEVPVIIRPYAARDKKVIISNVPPYISNSVIEEYLESINVSRASSVVALKASIRDAEYNHVICHRRQVYITNDDVNKIPNAIKLKIGNTLNTIFFTTEIIKCFKCGAIGHIARNCEPTTNEHHIPSNNHTEEPRHTPASTAPPLELRTVQTLKRTKSQAGSSVESLPNEETNNLVKHAANNLIKKSSSKQAQKKGKTTHSEATELESIDLTDDPEPEKNTAEAKDLTEELEPIKNILKEEGSFLNYSQFKALLENTRGSKGPISEIINIFTEDHDGLIEFINNLYDKVDKTTKNRFTRLIKKIVKLPGNEANTSTENNASSADPSEASSEEDESQDTP